MFRRSFLASLGVLLAGLVLAPFRAKAAPELAPTKPEFDPEVEIIRIQRMIRRIAHELGIDVDFDEPKGDET